MLVMEDQAHGVTCAYTITFGDQALLPIIGQGNLIEDTLPLAHTAKKTTLFALAAGNLSPASTVFRSDRGDDRRTTGLGSSQ